MEEQARDHEIKKWRYDSPRQAYTHDQMMLVINRLDAAEAIVAKLPKTADGVPVVPGMVVWIPAYEGTVCCKCYVIDVCVEKGTQTMGKWDVVLGESNSPGSFDAHSSEIFSTREAAETAKA